MTDDAALIRRYLDGSEEAFAELVRCHIGAVHGTALRLVAGDAHLADDITQKVFTSLARKARSLVNRPVLLGWLYLSTQYEAAKAVRSEQRRRAREQKAHVMQEIQNEGGPEPEWVALRPVLDGALRELKETDRDALLLRFFQARTLRDVGEALGLNENAARMRVDRALEKLRAQLARRGITSTSVALGAVLAGQVATAAPATLAASVTGAALAGSVAASGGGVAALFMGMTKLQIGVAATLAVAGGSTLWTGLQAEAKFRAENAALVAQVAEASSLRVEKSRREEAVVRADTLRRETGDLAALRSEEARLRQALAQRPEKPSPPLTRANPELTADGQPILPMNQLDVKPVLLGGLKMGYPAEMKLAGIPGEALVTFVVDADGNAREPEIIKSTNDAFAAATLKAMEQLKFKPGEKDGVAVNARIEMPIMFSISSADPDWF